MGYQRIDKLIDRVESILREFEQARNDDKYLAWQLWKRFYMIPDQIDYEIYKQIPADAEIKRARAKIQNTDKKYPPTEWAVAKERGWNETVWRQALGYELILN